MPLFGKRRTVQSVQNQQQTGGVEALEAAQSEFSERFRLWLEAIEHVQGDTDAKVLTDEILGRVGALPVPQFGNGLLNRTQCVFLAAYARSYCGSMLENRKIEAVVAAAGADESGDANAENLRCRATYWENVEAYVTQALG